MPEERYKSAVYTAGAWNAPKSKTATGLCLSGGGSRALSAGLGQLIGLKSLGNGTNNTVLDAVDYISSVSGGTWLTSLFAFSCIRNLDELLGVYASPDTLTEENIGDLPGGSVGHAPGRLSYSDMIDIVHQEIGLENILWYPEVRRWTWPVIVGELILRPYGLYDGQMDGEEKTITPMPRRFFSLNPAHMQHAIKDLAGKGLANGDLSIDDFYFHQNGPFPILNTNIKVDADQADAALLPIQATPVAIGATGVAGEGNSRISANGGVEAFAFTSDWQSQPATDALVEIGRRYSLIDIVACSSAFFAETVGRELAKAAAAYQAGFNAARGAGKETYRSREGSILDDLASFVPRYNYWPAGVGNPDNRSTAFADGGNLDNTGLLGMLARSDAERILVCYNAETPLGDREEFTVEDCNEKICSISTDIPVLFGYQPAPVNNTYVKFGDHTPADLKYLAAAQVFEASAFAPLVRLLFAASNGEQSPAVARTSSLKVCDNSFAGICKRGEVDVLWLYNNYARDWVNEIHRNSWLLADNISLGRNSGLGDFANFPNYDTGLQVQLNATQVNALAQFQAWIINRMDVQIKDLFAL